MSGSQLIFAFGRGRRGGILMRAAAGILLGVGLPVIWTQPALGESSAPAAGADLSLRGARLRAEITAAYEELRQNGALRFAPQGGNDVTPLVLKYIPLGATMEDATAVLRAAGYYLTTSVDGALYARVNLGGGFPNFRPSGLEILMRAAPDSAHSITRLQAEIFRKPNVSDQK
jgi:hypothetical protein